MATTQSKHGRRFEDEFRQEAAALARRPGATIAQVAHDLGVSAWSVARWRRRFAPAAANGVAPAPGAAPSATSWALSASSVPELQRQIKALQRENADLREQRQILKKAVAIFSEAPR